MSEQVTGWYVVRWSDVQPLRIAYWSAAAGQWENYDGSSARSERPMIWPAHAGPDKIIAGPFRTEQDADMERAAISGLNAVAQSREG